MEFLTAKEIAEMLQLSYRSTRDRLVHTPGFPKPVLLNGSKRWVKEEVTTWVLNQRVGVRK